jgi:hypothetical protein
MLWFYASNRSDHVTLGPLKILGPFRQRRYEIKDATVKQIVLWTFSTAECEHDRKKNCDCNGDDIKRIPTNMLEIACFVSARLRMVRMVVDSTAIFYSPIFGLCFNSPEIGRKRTLSSPSAVPQVSLDSLFINHRPSHA